MESDNGQVTAIIPARGGSVGVPNKNMQIVGGCTLLRRAVVLCKSVVDQVVVSSDSDLILAEAKRCGAIPIRRPAELATSDASSVDVMRHTRDTLCISGTILQYQCTAPRTTKGNIIACLDGLSGYDMACLVHPYHGFIIQDGKCINASLVPVPRRQDMRRQYEIAGSAWCYDASYLDKDFYTGNVNWVPVFGNRLDIDTPEDLWIAKQLVREPWHMPDAAVTVQGGA